MSQILNVAMFIFSGHILTVPKHQHPPTGLWFDRRRRALRGWCIFGITGAGRCMRCILVGGQWGGITQLLSPNDFIMLPSVRNRVYVNIYSYMYVHILHILRASRSEARFVND